MNFALLISTFVTVFLAELGDKTQLATVAISGTSDRPLAVFIGSSSALVLASLIGALAGGSSLYCCARRLVATRGIAGFLDHRHQAALADAEWKWLTGITRRVRLSGPRPLARKLIQS